MKKYLLALLLSSVAACGCNWFFVKVSFVPTDLSGCIVWLDSTYGVTESGGAVSQWTDRVGGYNFVQSTGSAKPTYSSSDSNFNNKPSLSFDGGDFLYSSTAIDYGPSTIFLVASINSTRTVILDHAYSNSAWEQDWWCSDSSYVCSTLTVSHTTGSIFNQKRASESWAVSSPTPSTYMKINGGTNATYYVTVNDTTPSLTVVSGTDPGSLTWNAAVYLFKASELYLHGSYTTGVVAEMVIYNRGLNGTEITQVKDWLKSKYAHY